jgi:hypothetical protein
VNPGRRARTVVPAVPGPDLEREVEAGTGEETVDPRVREAPRERLVTDRLDQRVLQFVERSHVSSGCWRE